MFLNYFLFCRAGFLIFFRVPAIILRDRSRINFRRKYELLPIFVVLISDDFFFFFLRPLECHLILCRSQISTSILLCLLPCHRFCWLICINMYTYIWIIITQFFVLLTWRDIFQFQLHLMFLSLLALFCNIFMLFILKSISPVSICPSFQCRYFFLQAC